MKIFCILCFITKNYSMRGNRCQFFLAKSRLSEKRRPFTAAPFYASSVVSRSRKSSEMHHTAAMPTSVYTIRLTVAVCPPNRYATRSKRKSPTRPQFSPPMTARMSAILSMIMFSGSFAGFAQHDRALLSFPEKKKLCARQK